jgi:hypothetical protein
VETEEVRKLRLEVMKLATQHHLCAGDAGRAVEIANTLWSFFEGPTATVIGSSEPDQLAA